jgi:hypothetical protein
MIRRYLIPSLVASATLFAGLLDDNESLAQPVVLESSVMGAAGHVSGSSISTAQFVGWRFQTTQTLTVDHVGGHLLSIPDEPGDIFAAIVRLPSITSVPAGAPFNPDEIVATTTFTPPFPSAEVFTPLSTTLTPGAYTLVFGTGLFGATGEAAAPNFDDQPDIPPTDLSSFIFWSVPFFNQPFEWRQNLASHMRFVIEAQVAIPGDFNHNGVVDAGDYVVWRKTAGSTTDYNTWRTNFGRTTATGTSVTLDSTSTTVPEPASFTILLNLAAVLLARSRRRRK